jgi:hypothetical protein
VGLFWTFFQIFNSAATPLPHHLAWEAECWTYSQPIHSIRIHHKYENLPTAKTWIRFKISWLIPLYLGATRQSLLYIYLICSVKNLYKDQFLFQTLVGFLAQLVWKTLRRGFQLTLTAIPRAMSRAIWESLHVLQNRTCSTYVHSISIAADIVTKA